MTPTEITVSSLLIDIEAELRRLGFWEKQPPSELELTSTQPFCIDTLRFEQWMQWVFLPRLQNMVALKQPLPKACEVFPYAEEALKHQASLVSHLLSKIKQLDKVITNS